jgi:hypothetical protein
MKKIAAAAALTVVLTGAAYAGTTLKAEPKPAPAKASTPAPAPTATPESEPTPIVADLRYVERRVRLSMNREFRKNAAGQDNMWVGEAGRVHCVFKNVGGKAGECITNVTYTSEDGSTQKQQWTIDLTGDLLNEWQWEAGSQAR